ncbi:MAG TPA: winged helix-turn-helix domain-containing protein [Gaiellaceae bacterium]
MTERPDWTFLTSHGFVLIAVAKSPDATVRELAGAVGLTERQAHRVLADLADAGYILRERVGRRNHYRVNSDVPMRHPSFAHHQVGDLLSALDAR